MVSQSWLRPGTSIRAKHANRLAEWTRLSLILLTLRCVSAMGVGRLQHAVVVRRGSTSALCPAPNLLPDQPLARRHMHSGFAEHAAGGRSAMTQRGYKEPKHPPVFAAPTLPRAGSRRPPPCLLRPCLACAGRAYSGRAASRRRKARRTSSSGTESAAAVPKPITATAPGIVGCACGKVLRSDSCRWIWRRG